MLGRRKHQLISWSALIGRRPRADDPLRKYLLVVRTLVIAGAIAWVGTNPEILDLGKQLSSALHTLAQQIEAAETKSHQLNSEGPEHGKADR